MLVPFHNWRIHNRIIYQKKNKGSNFWRLLSIPFSHALNIGRALILAGLPLPERKRTLPIPEPRGRGGETRLPATPHGGKLSSTLVFRKQISVRFWRLMRTFPLDEVRPGLPLLRYIQKGHESRSGGSDTRFPKIYLPKTFKILDFGRFFEMGVLPIDPLTPVSKI